MLLFASCYFVGYTHTFAVNDVSDQDCQFKAEDFRLTCTLDFSSGPTRSCLATPVSAQILCANLIFAVNCIAEESYESIQITTDAGLVELQAMKHNMYHEQGNSDHLNYLPTLPSPLTASLSTNRSTTSHCSRSTATSRAVLVSWGGGGGVQH